MANRIPSSATSDAKAQQSALHLPPEILDQIILHFVSFQPGPLGRHDLKELLTLSLISKAWLIATRRQLWSRYSFRFPELNYDRFCTLRWLYSSPHYSLCLETIEELIVSLEFPLLDVRNFELEWCGEALKGVKTITIERPVHLMGQTATFHDCLIGGFSSFSGVTTLKLERVTFTSLNQFYELLIAFGDSLETLKCWQICICEDLKPVDLSVTDAIESELSCDRRRLPIRIRSLEIDSEALFRLVHVGGLELVGLEELTLEERLLKSASDRDPLLAGLNAVGQTLTHCGKDLRRLKFRLLPGVTYGSLQHLRGKETPKPFDLPVQAPLLQEIDIKTILKSDCVLSNLLQFSLPHKCLSFIEIPNLPSPQKRLELDRALELSVPRLKRLVFSARIIPNEEHHRLGVINPRLRMADLPVGTVARDKAIEFMDQLGREMPWCQKMECLHPVFSYVPELPRRRAIVHNVGVVG